jgi:hypothetical protein
MSKKYEERCGKQMPNGGICTCPAGHTYACTVRQYKKPVVKVCPGCDTEFSTKYSRRLYCSDRCAQRVCVDKKRVVCDKLTSRGEPCGYAKGHEGVCKTAPPRPGFRGDWVHCRKYLLSSDAFCNMLEGHKGHCHFWQREGAAPACKLCFSPIGRGTYCSKDCHYEAERLINAATTVEGVCKVCGATYVHTRGTGARNGFCTERCRGVFNRNALTERKAKHIADQLGLCGSCKEPLPKDTKYIHLDHDHNCCEVSNTNLTCGNCDRGVLCNNCNSGLGHFKDSVVRSLQAATYLSTASVKDMPRDELSQAIAELDAVREQLYARLFEQQSSMDLAA